MTNPYLDIINLPHHRSATHLHMSSYDRAAQFSPFAALTGYEDAITETARLTDVKIDLDEYDKAALNEQLNLIQDTLDEQLEVSITYFLPDKKKAGGMYVIVTGGVKKIDAYERIVVMLDATKIPIDDISEIKGSLFVFFEKLD